MTTPYPPGASPEGGQFGAVPWASQPGVVSAQPQVVAASAPRPYVAKLTAALLAGRLVASLGPAPAAGWLIPRMSVKASTVPVTLEVYTAPTGAPPAGDVPVTVSLSGDGDEYDANQPIYVAPGEYLVLAWLTGSGSASARIEYKEVTTDGVA